MFGSNGQASPTQTARPSTLAGRTDFDALAGVGLRPLLDNFSVSLTLFENNVVCPCFPPRSAQSQHIPAEETH
jgi:hypothetical protein